MAFLFDGAGGALFFWLRFFPRPQRFKRILLIRLDQIGDIVLTLPALDTLRRSFPEAQIDFFLSPWALPLLEHHSGIDQIYVFENSYFGEGHSKKAAFREWARYVKLFLGNRYDLAIDFRGDIRNILLLFLAGVRRRIGYSQTGGGFLLTDLIPEDPTKHQVERNLECVRPIGCRPEPFPPRLLISPDHKRAFQTKFQDLWSQAPRPWILIQMGSGYPSKRWPVHHFALLIEGLLGKKRGTVILMGQEGEAGLPLASFNGRGHFYNLVGKTTLSELCALLDAADLFIGNDSGPAHLAAALGKKVVSLFSGTNDWRLWQPRGEAVSVLHHDVPCSPCHDRICRMPRHACMEDLSVEEVLKEVEGLLHV